MFNSLFTNACSNRECSFEGKFDVAQALAANRSTVTISPVSFSFELGRGTLAQLELDQTNTSCFINGVQVYPACHNLLRVFPGAQA